MTTGSPFVEALIFCFGYLTMEACMDKYVRKVTFQAYTGQYNRKTRDIMVAATGRYYCHDGT